MNFGMGLTRVRFGDYLLGTGFGILAGTFIFTFFIGNLSQVWAGVTGAGSTAGKPICLSPFLFSRFSSRRF